jgi:tRNA G18 (ribose-2'-O)-methylase SpoU
MARCYIEPMSTTAPVSRGYFAIGAEGISKAVNLGNLARTANAFGASFVFLVDPDVRLRDALATDTSGAAGQLPLYQYPSVEALTLPRGCSLVGVELVDEAVELPSFRHPSRAAYVFGAERSSLSPAMRARCRHLVRIPTRFCVNLAIAGAIVMYDRWLVHGRFAERPVGVGGPLAPPAAHVHGRPLLRR